jgi:hypothetical protein
MQYIIIRKAEMLDVDVRMAMGKHLGQQASTPMYMVIGFDPSDPHIGNC